MHFLFHGSADWKFKANVLEGPKLTGGSGEDSAAFHSLGGFSNKVGPMTLFLLPYSLLWGLVNLEVTCISLLLDETSLPRKVLSRSLGQQGGFITNMVVYSDMWPLNISK